MWFCEKCGSTRIKFTAFVLPNEGMRIEGDPCSPIDGTWCKDCNDWGGAVEGSHVNPKIDLEAFEIAASALADRSYVEAAWFARGVVDAMQDQPLERIDVADYYRGRAAYTAQGANVKGASCGAGTMSRASDEKTRGT